MSDPGYKFLMEHLRKIGITAECVCHQCIDESDIREPSTGFPLSSSVMIVCPTCGNKRCPHASDHRLDCTGSNAPGQIGSVYQ